MIENAERLIIDIDSLVDTRQGVLSKMLPVDNLTRLVTSLDYLERKQDVFPGVDPDLYKEEWEKRNIETIQNSIVSYVFNIVRNRILSYYQMSVRTEKPNNIELLLNLYPYTFTRSQMDDFRDMVFKKLRFKVIIECTFKSPEEITPLYIAQKNLHDVFIYDTTRWANAQMEKLEKLPIPKHTVHLPTLVDKIPTEEEVLKIERLGYRDVFEVMEFLLSSRVGLNYLPISQYSNVITVSAYMRTIERMLNERTDKERERHSSSDTSKGEVG